MRQSRTPRDWHKNRDFGPYFSALDSFRVDDIETAKQGSELRVGGLYGVMRDTTGSDSGVRGGNFGGLYDISKRTTLYGFASYMQNQTNAGSASAVRPHRRPTWLATTSMGVG